MYPQASGLSSVACTAVMDVPLTVRRIGREESHALYQRYREEFARYGNLYFCGRLAEYRYYNMDVIIGRALELSDKLVGEAQ